VHRLFKSVCGSLTLDLAKRSLNNVEIGGRLDRNRGQRGRGSLLLLRCWLRIGCGWNGLVRHWEVTPWASVSPLPLVSAVFPKDDVEMDRVYFHPSQEETRRVPFIQDGFQGCGVQLEYLGGGLLSVSGLDNSRVICLSLWKGREWLVDDQLLSDRAGALEHSTLQRPRNIQYILRRCNLFPQSHQKMRLQTRAWALQ